MQGQILENPRSITSKLFTDQSTVEIEEDTSCLDGNWGHLMY